MRIHRIRLQHVAGVDDRELCFDGGVTVVVGPNETGKSTIATALQLLLEQKDRYDNAEIRAVRPVHTDADPTIELECTTGPYHLTYRKCFGATATRRATSLQIHTPSPDSLTGDEAHDRMRAILDETVDEQLWSALRVQQRKDVGQADLTASGSLAAALETAAGSAATAGEHDTLLARVDEEAAVFWTDTGRPRKPLTEADAAVEDARARLDDARVELAEAADATTRHDQLAAQLGSWRRDLPALEARAKESAAAIAEIRVHRDTLAETERRLAAARAAAMAAKDALTDRQRLVERVGTLRRAVDVCAVDTERARAAAARADEAVAQARQDRDEARAELDTSRRALRRAEGDVRLLRLDAEAETLRRRVEDAQQLFERRSAVTERLDDRAPSAAVIRRLEKLDADARLAAGVLEAGLPRLRVEGPATTEVAVDGSTVPLGRSPHEQTVDRPLHVRVGDVDLTVTPGSTADDLMDRHTDAVRALRDELDEVGAATVGEARDRREAAADAQRELDATEAAWKEVVRADGVEGLRAALVRTETSIAELSAERPEGEDLPADVLVAEQVVAARRNDVEAVEGDVTTLEAATDAALERAAAVRTAATQAELALEAARARATEVAADLEDARERADDATVAAAVAAAEAAVTAATDSEHAARAVLDDLDVAGIEADAEAAAARVASTREQMRQADTERAELSGRIAVVTERGLGEQVPHLEAELVDVEGRRDARRRHADALLLLRETLHRHQDEARARYQAPLRAEVERLGRVVFGSDFGVELDETLRIVRRTVGGRTLDVEQLSGGAQEQLAIITRLAVASLVDEDDGVPLILDDALGYADPIRTDRVNTLLSSVGDTNQVIVLTCDPDRFAGVAGATTISI